ncbi:RNA-guided endonuclease InsQ/TnpB family protein [Armatimonas sp.]|uniref:RNA-guided endonuclease InsQ/TnpB family protein n=1 Tax=Armatimonas sp. TaxID=1872638 RepID=UPI003752CE8F
MKLVAQIKLLPTQEQAELLKQTMVKTNEAACRVSDWAFSAKVFGRFDLHYQWYETIRNETGLTAQIVALLFAKVADAYKRDTQRIRAFRPLGAITYDSRVLRYVLEKRCVSIWTLTGRERIPFVCGEHQTELLKGLRGESDLVFLDGAFYLMATCDIEDPPLREVNGTIGIDLGIVQIASDSEGNQYSGEPIRKIRRALRRLRAGLQQCGSKSAKRHLQRLRCRQARFTRWVNHNISRRLVETAARLGKALVLEDLSGIRERGNGFSREMRFELGNWSFDQLKQFVTYKARRAGIPVVLIDPRNTSRTCSICGYCAKHNRKSQSVFKCKNCGLEMNADRNAAVNISGHGAFVTRPMDGTMGNLSLLSKPPALAGG